MPLREFLNTFVLQLWTSEGKGWGRSAASKLNCQTEGLRDLYVDALLQGRHQQLCDFDDHLNDIAKYGSLTRSYVMPCFSVML